MNRKERRAAAKGKGSAPGGGGDASLFALAVREHQAGRLAEAEKLYQQVLAHDRNHVASLHHLGIMALQRGEPQAAIEPIRRAIAIDARTPDFHYNLALAFQTLGRLNEAIDCYQAAIRIKPDYVEALTNLGNTLMQAGKAGEAVVPHERVAALTATPEAHFNLANALAQSRRLDQSVTQYRRVLVLKPDFAGAHNNLANALAAQGKSEEALLHVQKALALDPNFADAYVNLGNLLQAEGKLAEAAAQFERALSINPNSAYAHGNRGNVFLAQGRLDDAAQSFQRALALNPALVETNNNLGILLAARGDYPQAIRRFEFALAGKPDFIDAYNNLARALMATGQMDPALGVLRRALSIEETVDTKALFVQCVRATRVPPDSEDFRVLILRALLEPWGRPSDLAPTLIKLLKSTDAIRACMARTAATWPRRLRAEELFGVAGLAVVASDQFLRGLLESAQIDDIEFERFLTNARFAMLGIVSSGETSAPVDEKTVGFCCTLARQCFVNEYVFFPADGEVAEAEKLRDKVSAALAAGTALPAHWVAVLASYSPLGMISGAGALLDRQWPEALSTVLTQQLREPAEEAALRATIPSLTPIENAVSRMVQQQYEENPYPRWARADPGKKRQSFDQHLRNKFPAAAFKELGKPAFDMLIAGCGTGQHAIESTARFSNVRVLAIDLSVTSLAYAVRQTRDLGVRNIEYAQADILQLGSIGQSFDVIESSGVLHHLADPFAGWRVLLSLLRPGGFMAVALYSEIARADIVKARTFIAEHGYGATADDIRRCRQGLIVHEGGRTFRNVISSQDFFSISSCRDLLFHVQEHRMTLPQIAAFLAENELSLIGFELETAVAGHYSSRYPADKSMIDLASWDAYEREFPHTFSGMYQFWVQKKG